VFLPPAEAVRHEQVISDAGWSKLDFAERDKCKPVPLRLSLARNLGTEWRERGYGLWVRFSVKLRLHELAYCWSSFFDQIDSNGKLVQALVCFVETRK
jgi:hypothetical protein